MNAQVGTETPSAYVVATSEAEARKLAEELMEVMNILRDAGYLKLALVGLEGTKP